MLKMWSERLHNQLPKEIIYCLAISKTKKYVIMLYKNALLTLRICVPIYIQCVSEVTEPWKRYIQKKEITKCSKSFTWIGGSRSDCWNYNLFIGIHVLHSVTIFYMNFIKIENTMNTTKLNLFLIHNHWKIYTIKYKMIWS